MAQSLRGTFTPLLTPFTTEGSIDFPALGGLIADQLSARVEGLVMLGTTGESPTIEAPEFDQIVGFAVKQAKGKSMVIAGVGSNDTKRTIDQARRAEDLGVDGLLVLCPYYSKPTQMGIRLHFEAIAEAVGVPQIVYNIAGRTGINVETDTLVALSGHPCIIGVKEASNDIDQIMTVIDQTPDDFSVLCGSDHLNLTLMCHGGDGVISTLANLVPKSVKALVDAVLVGDLHRARRLHYQLLPLARGCFLEGNPIPVKTALAMQGKLEEMFRLPICPMQPETRQIWQNILRDHRLLPAEAGAAAA